MMLVLVVAAAGSGVVVTARRRRWLNSKPQRRFKLHLTDNSDRPFQHLCSSSSSGSVSASAPDPQAAAEAGKNSDQTVSTEQQQQAEHPYAEQIAAILQHPRCPDFTPPPPSSSNNTLHHHHHQQQQQGLASLTTAAGVTLPQPPPPLEHTPCLWVDTPRKLQQMLTELQGVTCIALDTEHNSQRSYLGMLCLLQLSTGTRDYLLDALALHDHLPLLRPLMGDPAVLKVLHGGANDIAWLQRDAHVYLVNVFDTEKAAHVLGREERSLAHLLRRYCGVSQDKSHQTADWRLRPLAPQLQAYARSDVHWLLFLAGLMVGELQARSPSTTGDLTQPGPMLTSTLQKSNTLTLKLYRKSPAAVTVSNATAAAMRRYAHAQQQQQQQICQQQQQQRFQFAGGRGGLPVVAAAAATAGAADPSADAAAQATGSANGSGAIPTAAAGAAAAAAGNGGVGRLDELALLCVRQRLAALVAWRDAAARADDEGPQFILPDAALLELVGQPPSTAKQLLSVVERHTASLNTAVQHLPAAPHWVVSAAARRGAKQLLALLAGATAAAGSADSSIGAAEGAPAEGASGSNAAAAETGTADGSSSVAAGTPALMVNGQLVVLPQQGEQQQGPGGIRQQRDKSNREFRARLIKKFSAKTQVYDNCRMLATTGELLCYCDARKLHWYLDKGLAEMVTEEPPTIRLLFEHKNADQQMGLDGFYSTSRANRCVVCGCEEHYLRYRVVPACYRRCFPPHLKSHRSHDIVLLCVDCHQLAHKAAERVKRDVAAQFNIPLQPTVQYLQQRQQRQQPPAAAAAAAATAAAADGLEGGDSSGSDADPATAGPAGPAAADGSLLRNGDSEMDADADAAAAADAAAGTADFLSTYHRGDPQPVYGLVLAHQARAAAIALVRFGDSIPPDRRRQLELLVARFVGKDVSAADSSSGPLVTPAEIQAAAMAGLGERKRVKTLKKLRKNLRQMQEQGFDASAADAGEDAAADADADREQEGKEGSGEDSLVVQDSGAAAAAAAVGGGNGAAASSGGGGDCSHAAAAAQAASSSGGASSSDAVRLQQQLSIRKRPEEQGHLWHGQQVVAAAMARGGEAELQELVRRFRQVFVVACQPKYLPANWAVDAQQSRQFGEYSVYAQAEAAKLPAAGAAAAAAAEDGIDAPAGGTAGGGGEQVQGGGVKKNGSNGGQQATGMEADSFGAACLSILGHKTALGC